MHPSERGTVRALVQLFSSHFQAAREDRDGRSRYRAAKMLGNQRIRVVPRVFSPLYMGRVFILTKKPLLEVHMKISINANRCEPSPMRKFHPLAVKAKEAGRKIYHLNIGQPDLQTPTEFYEAVRSFDNPTLAYEASPGMPLLIEAIRKYYKDLGVDLDLEDIFITTGGSEALLITCLSILDPYTEVIIPEPYYPNYTTFVHAAGGVIRALHTGPEEGYHYANRRKIEKLITKNTRAIMITNPGNPTGVVLDESEMQMIADIAKKNDLFSPRSGAGIVHCRHLLQTFLSDGQKKHKKTIQIEKKH